MTNTIDTPADSGAEAGGGSGLNAKKLPELKSIASGLGIKSAGLKKADLVSAIHAAQSGGQSGGGARTNGSSEPKQARRDEPKTDPQAPQQNAQEPAQEPAAPDGQPKQQDDKQERPEKQQGRQNQNARRNDQGDKNDQKNDQKKDQPQNDQPQNNQPQNNQTGNDGDENRSDDGEGGSRRNRRRRGRDRQNTGQGDRQTTGASERQGGQQGGGRTREPDTQILEDDVLTPCGGILDVLDNYAFVRTSGYLPGTDDVYVSLSMVRRLGLRRGDAITGQVRQPREGERKEKFNPLVKIDSVNGADPELARDRVEFDKLTPLYPSERLRMETGHDNLIGRVIDIAAPIGKGQRGLIVSPAKAGKTMVLQSIANSISANNPECHLMVVLVDERPEEVTDFQRSVNGEVISSTFDRPALDHTVVAELAIERAKRLVELGHDVVVLLDGITRLGRAYNLSMPASGRVLSGGVDASALHPPKKFFGAARNIENGGSLTILATALVESGSTVDEAIFEEFQGTANMELRLRSDLATKRIFPAVDAVQSSTRREELLMSEQELAIIWKLRRVLSGLDGQKALELLLGRLRKAQTNYEFLMQVQKSTPGLEGDEE